jgi:hypothetical protein
VYFGPASLIQSNDRYPDTWLYYASQTLKQGCGFRIIVPNNYVSGAVIDLFAVTTATSGVVNWDLAYRSIAVTESLDPSTDQETFANTATTVPGTTLLSFLNSFDLTDANLAAGDLLVGILYRDAVDAADTLAATAAVTHANLRYADT